MTVYHGSQIIVDKPLFGEGRLNNDYGQGFYCCEEIELAKEWSCQDPEGGFVNIYEIDMSDMNVLKINADNVVSWLAILMSNRIVRYSSLVERMTSEYIIEHFAPDISGYDAVKGYRADDSCFTFVRAFLSNTISLEQLRNAMELGGLGVQICLKSRKSFDKIRFIKAEAVDGDIYYPLRIGRDKEARAGYYKMLEQTVKDGIFARDIINREMTADELCIQ